MQRHEKPIGIAIADGFSPQDLYQGEYTRPLQEAAYPIIEQNRRLLTQIGMRGFRPAVDLDFTSNGAGVWIRQFFECVAEYEEGRVPWRAAKELFVTTDMLIDALKGLKNAPVSEIEAAGVAFRQAAILWKDNHPRAKMERKTYLKKHFASEKEICDKLNALHAAYVRIYAAKGRKKATFSAANQMEDDNGKAKERRVIFAEIDRLVNLGNSIPKAIAIMKRGSYEARMRGVKAETWRRYYLEDCRKKELRKRRNETINETVNAEDDRVNYNDDRVNDRVKPTRDRVKVTHDRVKLIRDRVKVDEEALEGDLFEVIMNNPGLKSKKLSELILKSVPTVSRYLKVLKEARKVEFRGAPKTGGYYACAF